MGPFYGELGDYDELNVSPRIKVASTVDTKDNFSGKGKPRNVWEKGMHPVSNNPTEKRRKGNRDQGQLIKEGENSAVTNKMNFGNSKGKTKTKGSASSGSRTSN
jgi:hypothetical protein